MEPRRLLLINDRFDFRRVRLDQAAYYLKRYEALSQHARKKGMVLHVWDRHAKPEDVLRAKPDGLILTIFGHGSRVAQQQKAFWTVSQKIPSVYWASDPPQSSVDYVGPDEKMGVMETLDRVMSLGFRKLGFFGPLDEPFTRERFQAFCIWHRHHKLALKPEWSYPYDAHTGVLLPEAKKIRKPSVSDDRFYLRQVRVHSEKWRALGKNELPEIIVCDTDSSARYLIQEWGGIPGRTMPGIVGYDDLNMPLEPWGYNYLSTVRYDLSSQANAVLGLLERRWRNPQATFRKVLVPSHSIIRLTSLPPVPGGSLAVAEGIVSFLRQHYRDSNITPLAIKKFGLSAQALQRRLSRATGKSWRHILEGMRVDSAAKELRETNKTVTEIYLDNGYRQHANFAKAFRRRFGVTPEKFRRSLK